ncbi:PREDICTED: patatin-like phospholipase domain-containing protein 5 isoform X1 [Chinchilla lanigera]|uniref:Patatin-like phospholipase domain-containing protein 5 n=1 Tax=Chinchilla lanigera TaxID=34839 RepID=A0A8C2YUF8_CHILA|nr:PREDICTED: patatin-like phospholipase domain-containing protein 5 isoform X1 [Chinchilla lanigera]
MGFLEKQGSWSLSFAGSGYLGLYHVGVIHCLSRHAPHLIQGADRFYGSSAGALGAISIISSKSVDFCCSSVMAMVKHVEGLSLGIFHPAYAPIEYIRQRLRDTLPEDCHILASQRLGISLTHWPDGHNVIVTDFATKEELIQATICTLFLPLYCGTIPPEFRGERYMDGALSNSMPFASSPSTITISPYHGTGDICPQSPSASLHELNAFHASFQICTSNFYLGWMSLFPPKPEVVADISRQGYLDAHRFLEQRGLIKELVLWTLVSKERPAPAKGGDGEFNWDVPHLRVKDVPDFERVAPELEAALKKACQRDSGAWARFRHSGPGWALTYLLLPWSLPFEYIYYRSRRLALWLPEAPTDLRWVWGLMKGTANGVFCRMKAGLSLPAASARDTGSHQPRAAGTELRSAHPACRGPGSSLP